MDNRCLQLKDGMWRLKALEERVNICMRPEEHSVTTEAPAILKERKFSEVENITEESRLSRTIDRVLKQKKENPN